MSQRFVQSDLRSMDERKITVLKPKGVRSGGSACWAYLYVSPIVAFTMRGEQCSQAVNAHMNSIIADALTLLASNRAWK